MAVHPHRTEDAGDSFSVLEQEVWRKLFDEWLVAEADADWRNEPSQTKQHASNSGEGSSLEEILDACFERSFVHLAVAHDEIPRQLVQRHASALEAQGVEHHL